MTDDEKMQAARQTKMWRIVRNSKMLQLQMDHLRQTAVDNGDKWPE